MEYSPANLSSVDSDVIEKYEEASKLGNKTVTDLEYEEYLNQRIKVEVDSELKLKENLDDKDKKKDIQKYLRLSNQSKKDTDN